MLTIKFASRYERQLEGPNEKRRKTKESPQLTTSKTSPYEKNVCFFCEGEGDTKQPALHSVTTVTAGESLNTAIDLSGSDILRGKLSTSVDPIDAHAIDIKYHKKCWLRNVTNVIRKAPLSEESGSDFVNQAAAKIEFLAATESTLREGQILTMAEIQTSYEQFLQENDAHATTSSRKSLKVLLQSEIPDIEFHKPMRVNEPERISIKQTRDVAIQLTESMKANCDDDMKVIFGAAATLRKAINRTKRREFTGKLERGHQ